MFSSLGFLSSFGLRASGFTGFQWWEGRGPREVPKPYKTRCDEPVMNRDGEGGGFQSLYGSFSRLLNSGLCRFKSLLF